MHCQSQQYLWTWLFHERLANGLHWHIMSLCDVPASQESQPSPTSFTLPDTTPNTQFSLSQGQYWGWCQPQQQRYPPVQVYRVSWQDLNTHYTHTGCSGYPQYKQRTLDTQDRTFMVQWLSSGSSWGAMRWHYNKAILNQSCSGWGELMGCEHTGKMVISVYIN